MDTSHRKADLTGNRLRSAHRFPCRRIARYRARESTATGAHTHTYDRASIFLRSRLSGIGAAIVLKRGNARARDDRRDKCPPEGQLCPPDRLRTQACAGNVYLGCKNSATRAGGGRGLPAPLRILWDDARAPLSNRRGLSEVQGHGDRCPLTCTAHLHRSLGCARRLSPFRRFAVSRLHFCLSQSGRERAVLCHGSVYPLGARSAFALQMCGYETQIEAREPP